MLDFYERFKCHFTDLPLLREWLQVHPCAPCFSVTLAVASILQEPVTGGEVHLAVPEMVGTRVRFKQEAMCLHLGKLSPVASAHTPGSVRKCMLSP